MCHDLKAALWISEQPGSEYKIEVKLLLFINKTVTS